jgi:glycosyltransferase involved in cell wall biosynthesis
MHKKKILFFLISTVGGAERLTILIAKMLPQDEFEVKFVVVDKLKGEMTQFIPEDSPVEYLIQPNIWLGTYKIYRTMKRERPYAVFCSAMYLNCHIAFYAHLLGIKCILRNCNYMSTERWDQNMLCRLTYPYADVVISQQEEMVDDIVKVVKIDRRKIVCLHNPIDKKNIEAKLSNVENPYAREQFGNDVKRFVWVGRIHYTKGQDLAIKAFYNVHKKMPQSHLYLVGKYLENDSYYNQLVSIIQKLHLQEYVHLIGFDSNPYKWIKYSDCFVLPSRIEGLPNTLIEAQYIGKPAAATKCIPVIERIITEGVNGYVAESENPNSLAESMLKAVKLGKINMTYQGASEEDFRRLFV